MAVLSRRTDRRETAMEAARKPAPARQRPNCRTWRDNGDGAATLPSPGVVIVPVVVPAAVVAVAAVVAIPVGGGWFWVIAGASMEQRRRPGGRRERRPEETRGDQ